MRNLKRALSLALASVMVMGMMVVGTSASYKDVSSEQNQEAIEVLQAVGIMVGDDNGNFNPDAKVTRNEMAVIMSNLLNLDYDYYRGINPFTDVPSWAAPYVAACAAEGVTGGIGNGLYGGSNNVTAAQSALMLMKALGYFQYAEDFGEDWQVATVRQASYISLFDGVNAKAEDALTRNQVAQMVLNALEADMVEFTGDVGSKVTINGATINVGYRAEYSTRTSTEKKYNTLVGGKTDISNQGQYYIQLGEELYNGKLTKKADTDDFARPATTWRYDSKNVGTYADKADYTYTKKVENGDIYSDLGSKVAKDDVTVYVNGVEKADYAVAIAKGGDTTVGESGNGVLTEVFYDKDSETMEIVQIHTYVGTVDRTVKATSSKDAYIVIGDEGGTAPASSLTYETEDFAEDDVVLYTYSADAKEVKSVVLAEEATGTVTRAENKKTNGEESQNVTIDGETYKAAKQFAGVEVSDVTVKEEYTVYVDSYGYMVKIEKVADLSSDYALVLATDTNSNNNVNSGFSGSKRAKLVFADGTVGVVPTAKNYTSTIANGTIVTYREDSDGVYTLRPVTTTASATNDDTFELVNNRAKIVLDEDGTSTTAIYGNSATVYVVYNNADDDWDSYTGAKNAPGIASKDLNDNGDIKHDETEGSEELETVTAYYYVKSGMTKIIFIVPDDDALVDTTGSKLLYIANGSVSNLIHDADGDYYEYDAIVDGEIKTIKVDYSEGKGLNGFYSRYSIDKYGIYDNLVAESIDNSKYFHTTTGVSKTSEDYTVTFGSYTYTVADGADIYYVDEDDEITVSSYKSITKDLNDEVFAIVKDNMVDTLIIVAVDDDEIVVPPVVVPEDGIEVEINGENIAVTVFDTATAVERAKAIEAALIKAGYTDADITVAGGEVTAVSAKDGSIKVTFNVTFNEISYFDMEDFGAWGESWPGAYNVGWKYTSDIDLDDIVSIEVGMKDASGKLIVRYTADAEQVAWQQSHSYVNDNNQSSAPFYTQYQGTALKEGRDTDWTVEKGSAFSAWTPATCYVTVSTAFGSYTQTNSL